MNRKRLEQIRGFLNYVACRAYRVMRVWMKGLHMTIDGWRSDRDEQGWKRSPKDQERWMNGEEELKREDEDEEELIPTL